MSKNRVINREILVIQEKTHKTFLRAHSGTQLFVRKWVIIIISSIKRKLYISIIN